MVRNVERGTRIKNARLRAGLSQQRLAERCNVNPKTVHNWESGTSRPQQDNHIALAIALKLTTAHLLALLEGVQTVAGHSAAQSCAPGLGTGRVLDDNLEPGEEADTDPKRRLALVGGVAAVAGLAAPTVLATPRRQLVGPVDPEHWEHVARAYALDYDIVPKQELLKALNAEIDALLADIADADEQDAKHLHAPLAVLLVNAAAAMGSVGYARPEIRRYWVAAARAAQRVSDPSLYAWVLAVEADRGIHLDRSIPSYTLGRASEALEVAAGQPSNYFAAVATKSALIAQAYVYARLGEHSAALAALQALQAHYERWGHVSEGGGYLSIDAPAVHQAAGFVHAQAGSATRASDELDLAVASTPAEAYGFRAMGELLRVLAAVRDRDLGGLSHALRTVQEVPTGSRTQVVLSVARAVADACPVSERRHPQLAQYVDYLHQST